MPTILVVEDDQSIARLIEIYLRDARFGVQQVSNGMNALAAFESHASEIALVILDLMLPDLDGRGVCRRIRDISDTPVIMVTALDDPRDKLEGFEYGADDYLTKPFDPDELVARVHAVLRRVGSPSDKEPSALDRDDINAGNLHINRRGFQASVGASMLMLTQTEYTLLATLAINHGQVLSRTQLAQRVWRDDLSPYSRTIDVHVSRLREKLAAANATVRIDAMRGVGYRLIETQ